MKPIIHVSFEIEKQDVIEIKTWAVQHEMSLTKVAEKLGITYQYLSRLLSRKEKVSQKLYQKFVKLGIVKKV